MKHLSILGILAIFALALNLYFAIGSNFNDFKQGFEDGQKSSTYDTQADSHGFRAEIRVTPISTPSDSLNLQLPGKTVKAPYQVSEITCLIKETPTMLITIIFSALGVIVLSVYGVYCLIRVLICITRQDIFSRRNIRWLRWIAYGQLAVTSLSFLLNWSIEQAVLAQVSLPGYQVTGVTPIPLQWDSVILIVLLTEIFATAVKIKEENDLTIQPYIAYETEKQLFTPDGGHLHYYKFSSHTHRIRIDLLPHLLSTFGEQVSAYICKLNMALCRSFCLL